MIVDCNCCMAACRVTFIITKGNQRNTRFFLKPFLLPSVLSSNTAFMRFVLKYIILLCIIVM